MHAPVLGLFYTKDPLALRPLAKVPYRIIGTHAISAPNTATDAGATACLWGRLRDSTLLKQAIRAEGVSLSEDAGDADLILASYRAWGDGMAERIQGSAAIAVIDRDADRLVLIRDRMGISPVFYARSGGGIAFSDHALPLLSAPGVQSIVNSDGLRELFALGPARTPGRTPLRDILELESGCCLIAEENSLRIRRYFALQAQEHTDSEQQTVERTRFLLEQAVLPTLPLQPSCMISGGLDSSAIMALYAHLSGKAPLGFSVDYEDDERYFSSTQFRPERDAPWAKLACEALGAKQICIELTSAQLSDALQEAVLAREFPGMGDIDSSMLLFARSISACSKATLMGECADEAFGGYPWFHRAELVWKDGFAWSGSMPLRESVLKKELREKLALAKYADMRYHEACAALPVLAGESEAQARLRKIQGLVFQFFMPNLQERALRMCSACGVEPLTPFCDDRLIQYLYNVPWPIKNLHGETKGLLREAVRPLLPDRLLSRPKSPYPKTCNPNYSRILRRRMALLIREPGAPLWQICDKEAVLALCTSPLSPADTPWFGQLMAGPQLLAYLLQVDQWLRFTQAQIDLD